MTDERRIQELLEKILDSRCTPEELCADSPELLSELRKRLRRLRRVANQIDELFPSSTSGSSAGAGQVAGFPAAELPRIDGYDVEGILGHGGMGVVYRARHLKLKRMVALKMLLAGAYASPNELARFVREAQAVAGLEHPHIVKVHDVGDLGGRPYFTMEFVPGGSLADDLAGMPQPARRAAELVALLADAVQLAHQNGIIHRDLKPANILMTREGTPKIADFGLARHVNEAAGLTRTGARVGTPSYMAPEQALGKSSAIGPAADVYALGAILYEMLTGRPPFRADTASETERQVIAEDPAPPSRLNANVPRDLETICLTCLHKDSARRYASAAELGDDLRRYLAGESVRARRVGWTERAFKWTRRHPAATVALSAVVLISIVLVAGGRWLAAERAATARGVENDLRDAAEAQRQASWSRARAALHRASVQLGSRGSNELRRKIEQCARELELVERLDEIHLKRVTRGELSFYKAQADQSYREAFREGGIGEPQNSAARVAATINASTVRPALVAALDDWSICASDSRDRGWVLEVAQQADPDPAGWRRRILDPTVWDDSEALVETARILPVKSLPVSLLLAVGERLRTGGRDAIPFLRKVQKDHADDFWANLILGNAILQSAPREAGGYYRAALASRPEAAVGYCAVGDVLELEKELDEAIDYYEKALEHDPRYARAYSNLGHVRQAQDRLNEAIDCYQKSLLIDPDYAWAHYNLGNALKIKGRLDEASEHYQQALHLDPDNLEVQEGIRRIMLQQGRGREAQVGWRKALDANPLRHDAWFGYAELCLFLEDDGEYQNACRSLLDRFGSTADPYIAERVSRSCLLRPGTRDQLQQGVALADLAMAASESTPDWIYRYFLFAKGLAEYRLDRFDGAISVMSGKAATVMGPSPRLIVAMAQYRQGEAVQARHTLGAAIGAYDWRAAIADRRDILIPHILRREAESLVLPNLSAFLRGEYQPSDNDERLAFLGACQFKDLRGAAAALYAEAFANDPGLAEDLPAGRRYLAACCAALAGCGGGADGARFGKGERQQWRRQAREWLRADLDAWKKKLAERDTVDRALVRRQMTRWQADPDLAGLRDLPELTKLSTAEREECLALWHEAGELMKRSEAPQ
jgi:serine/threonine-protein kinase